MDSTSAALTALILLLTPFAFSAFFRWLWNDKLSVIERERQEERAALAKERTSEKARIERGRQEERAALAQVESALLSCGLSIELCVSLAQNTPVLQQKDSARAALYAQRLSDRYARLREVAATKPVPFSAAIAVSGEIKQTKEERKQVILARYKQECIDVVRYSNLESPPFFEPTECTVTHVIDGDTIEVNTSSGLYTVRLIGFDAPETLNPKKGVGYFGPEATNRMNQIAAPGKTALLWLDKDQRDKGWVPFDKYKRLCAHVSVDGVLLGLPMLAEGYADLIDVFPMDKPTLQLYKHARDRARAENKGMWKTLNTLSPRRNENLEDMKKFHVVTHTVELLDETSTLQDLIGNTTRDLFGSLLLKSARRIVLHTADCPYAKSIRDSNKEYVQWTEDLMESAKFRLCQHCGGDSLLLDS